MIATQPDCPASVTMLADHLDATLAAGEDLLALELAPRADLDAADPARAPDAFDQFVRRLAQLEASVLARLMLARRRAGELGRIDADIAALARLFRAGTEVVDELIAGLKPDDPVGLGVHGDGHAYLRNRGLIAPEAAAPSPFERLVVTESFRIGGRIALGQLLDMTAALLELLDQRFGLYQMDAHGDVIATGTPPTADLGVGTTLPEPALEPAVASLMPEPGSLADAIADARKLSGDDASTTRTATLETPPVAPAPAERPTDAAEAPVIASGEPKDPAAPKPAAIAEVRDSAI